MNNPSEVLMQITTGHLDMKQEAVELCVDLTALLAANAAGAIERDRHAFDYAPERLNHSGSPTRKVDADNSRLAEAWLHREDIQQRAVEGVRMETEETPARPFDHSNFRALFLRVDELDGTSNAAATAQNWSTAALAFVWASDYRKHVLAGGSIALPDGHIVSFINRTRHQPDGTPNTLEATVNLSKWDTFSPRAIGSTEPVAVRQSGETQDPPYYGDPDVVLVNASAGNSRYPNLMKKYPHLLCDTRYRSLCAGTPVVYAALRGLTGMIVDPGHSTLHDSTHLFVLAALRWEVLELETLQPVNLIEIAETHALNPGYDRPLPPTVAVRNREALRHLSHQSLAS
jgi:hypothetical protein